MRSPAPPPAVSRSAALASSALVAALGLAALALRLDGPPIPTGGGRAARVAAGPMRGERAAVAASWSAPRPDPSIAPATLRLRLGAGDGAPGLAGVEPGPRLRPASLPPRRGEPRLVVP